MGANPVRSLSPCYSEGKYWRW